MEALMGKSSINGPFSMAMSNNQRVIRKKPWWFVYNEYTWEGRHQRWRRLITFMV
jgi:hypothetical protein